MSNRDSLGVGDLLPQDVVDIFAQEKHSKTGRKKRSRSLGRALGWLKGKKKKDLGANGQNPGLGPAFDLALDGHPAGHQGGQKGGPKSGRQAQPQGNSHVPKRDDDDKTPAPPLFQENVFIETSRPKYLEDLHTEALEGLKMMQQEETNNGVEYQDTESTISTMSVQTDGEGGGFVTDSTIADTTSVVSVQSSVSTKSSRSGLTRQGSTFRPLNSGKKSEKAKTRRKHRKTVAGIPQHVQRELGLDRVGWALTQTLDEEQLYNGEIDCSPTTDGPQQAAESLKGATASLQAMNVIQPLNKDKAEQLDASHAGHRDDLALLHHLGPDLGGEQRPRSLAVPWLTTASLQQEPPSPVITMSPQAAYMSKIIPNAVLPPSIDVVEINRGRSRNSVRTVSKSSLLVSSPSASRASSRASCRTTSSRSSNITSASRHNHPNLSDSSCWSNSDSSDTLVSDSSTISSSSTPKQKRSQDGDASAKEDKVSVRSSNSKPSKYTSNGKLITKGDEVKKEGQFARSLSVMKSKKAPPPPSRSYSLHNKMKRRSRDLAEVRIMPGEASLHSISAKGEENGKNKPGTSPMASRIVDSPGYHADTSSLEDSPGSLSFSPFRSQLQVQKTEDDKKDAETVSKEVPQEKQEPRNENKLNKIISPSSGYSSQDGTSPQLSKQPHGSSPRHKKGILAKLQRLFPGPSSAGAAPSLPTQPEAPENTESTEEAKPGSVDTVSVSPSVRTLRDLFNIPPPPKVHAPPPPPPEVWAHSKRTFELLLGPPAPDNPQAIIKKNPKDRRQQRQSPSVSTEGSVKSLVAERKHKNPAVPVESGNGSLHVMEAKKVQESGILNVEIQKENNERLAQHVDLKVDSKGEKVKVSGIISVMLAKAAEKREERLAAMRAEEAKKASTQATEVKTNTDTLPAISLARISPSPCPAAAHHPIQPLKHTTEVASVTSAGVVGSPESSWPPPPPPMAQVGLSGPDEMDFPLPPPPMFGEEALVLPVQMTPKKSHSSRTPEPVVTVVKTGGVKVITGAEPQKPSTSQENAPAPLNIPPPPPYTAPPPPPTAVSHPTTNKVLLPPPVKVSPPAPVKVSPPPPAKVSPPPPAKVSPPAPAEVSPPAPVKVSPPAPVKVSPPPPVKVSPPAPVKVSPPPPVEVSLPLPVKVSPPPPAKVSPPPPVEVSLRPPVEFSPPPPVEISPPPIEISLPPPAEISPPPPAEVSPPPPVEVSLPPPIEISPPPPPVEVSPSPPVEVSPPPAVEVSLSPPVEISLPPPVHVPPPPPPVEVSLSPPVEISPPPPVHVPPPPEEVSPPPAVEVSLPPPPVHVPPPPEEVSPPPAVEVSPPPPVHVPPPPPVEVSLPPPVHVPPPPPVEVSLPPPVHVPPPPPAEVSPPPPVESSAPVIEDVLPLVKDISTLVTEASPSPVKEVSPQLVIDVSAQPPKEVSALSPEEITPPPPPQEDASQSSEEVIPVSKLSPPQSIPPLPPVPSQPQSSEQEIDLPQVSTPVEPETSPVSSNSILMPPQSIPPPPPIELLHQPQVVPLKTDGPASQEASASPPSEASVPPAPETSSLPAKAKEPAPPPLLPVQGLASIKHQPSPLSTENQNQEGTPAPVVEEEPTPIASPSLLQMVKLRSINSSPEPPKTQEQPQAEVIMRKQQPSSEVPTSSASGEAPQKPIRRSLIVTSPTSTSPPATVISQPALPKAQSIVVPPASSPIVISPVKKSPPVMTTSRSMNLQEAIRLRTAARSRESPVSRLSLHSPTSPVDIHKSPSSTASFIFSKSNKKVVIETKAMPEDKETMQKNLEVSSGTKVISEAESLKKGVKVPPPVAKKPKTKGKEVETSEGMKQTAGQEAQQEGMKESTEKTNGTAGSVEGGGT